MDKRLLLAEPIAEELKQFETQFADSIKSENERIQDVIEYMMRSDGKKIRPILLLLAAKSSGTINSVTYNAAITLELLHTASLIHDDVVDESKLRRGRPSLNAVYDNKMAVLAGDYYLSTALMKSVLTSNIEMIEIVSQLGRRLAEGELNQLSLVKELIINEDEYYQVIRQKTASLLSACMKLGALSTNASREVIDQFAYLGEVLGMIFQLRDDIFDYFEGPIGKPTGNDIREGKVTLPLIYALKTSPDTEKGEYLEIINAYNFTDENVDKLIKFAIAKGGVEYAYERINFYRTEAEKIISTIQPEDIQKALYATLDYIIERDH